MSLVIENGNVFRVECETLVQFSSPKNGRNVVIPHILKSGEKITTLGSRFCQGEYNKITISNRIKKIEDSAFANADVKEVCWSSGCRVIPDDCFHGSKIQKISNIDNVVEIGLNAFYSSGIRNFTIPPLCKTIGNGCFAYSLLNAAFLDTEALSRIGAQAFRNTPVLIEVVWPQNCLTIPDRCFYESNIKTISNIQNVKEVGAHAFEDSKINKMEWPKNCSTIPEYCFWNCGIEELTGLECVQTIERGAFASFSMPGHSFKIDISNSKVSFIGNGAFVGVGRANVIFPYYVLPEMIDSAFGLFF